MRTLTKKIHVEAPPSPPAVPTHTGPRRPGPAQPCPALPCNLGRQAQLGGWAGENLKKSGILGWGIFKIHKIRVLERTRISSSRYYDVDVLDFYSHHPPVLPGPARPATAPGRPAPPLLSPEGGLFHIIFLSNVRVKKVPDFIQCDCGRRMAILIHSGGQ